MLVESLLSRRAFESGASGWRGGAKLVAEVYKIYIYIYILYISPYPFWLKCQAMELAC